MNEGSDVVLFQRQYVELVGGDINAALMLSQIFYWYSPSRKTGKSKLRVFREGEWWLAKSGKDWEKELGTTPKQARLALAKLETLGIVATKLMSYGGAPVTHLRLAAVTGKQLLTSPNQVIPVKGLQGTEDTLGKIHLPLSANTFDQKAKSYTETTTETTTEINTKTAQSAKEEDSPPDTAEGSGSPAPGFPLQPEEGKFTGTGGSPDLKMVVILMPKNLKVKASALEVLKVVGAPAEGVHGGSLPSKPVGAIPGLAEPSSTPDNPVFEEQESNVVNIHSILLNKAKAAHVKHSMETQWNSCMSKTYELGFQKKLMSMELGQLKHIRTNVESTGGEGPDFLIWIFENWAQASTEVRIAQGLAAAPVRPQIGFLLKYIEEFINVLIEIEANKQAAVLEEIAHGIASKLEEEVVYAPQPKAIPYYIPTQEEIDKNIAFFMKKPAMVGNN